MLKRSSAFLATPFMDISIGNSRPKRVTFDLFSDKSPMAAENFLKLCTGEMLLPKVPTSTGLASDPQFMDQLKPQLTYKGSTFHRVVPGFMVQGGDIQSGSGLNQMSIFGRTFEAPAETESSVFDQRGLVGTAVSAPNMNGSQFFILTAKEARHLDKTCICFGRVATGMDVIDAIERLSLKGLGRPVQRVHIVNSGILP